MPAQPTLYRSLSNTMTATCSTSGRCGLGAGSLARPRHPTRYGRRVACSPSHAFPARKGSQPIPAAALGSEDAALFIRDASLASCPAGSNLVVGAPAVGHVAGSGPHNGRARAAGLIARSASVRTTSVSSGRGSDSSGGSVEEESGSHSANGSANGSAAHAEGGSNGSAAASSVPLFADLEDAVPYGGRNGSSKGANGPAAVSAPNGAAACVSDAAEALANASSDNEDALAAPSGAAAAGAAHLHGSAADAASNGSVRSATESGNVPALHDEVCVVEFGADGDPTLHCMPVADVPTVAAVMHQSPDPAAAAAAANARAAAANGAATAAAVSPTPAVVDAAIAVSLRPAGFGLPPDAIREHLAGGADLASDVRGTMDQLAADMDTDGTGAAMRRLTPATGSVDMADTPEGLADVEVSSVAPVADWLKDQDDITTLTYAVLTGGLVAAAVFIFDVSIQTIHDLPDIFSSGLGIGGGRKTGLEIFGMSVPFRCVMPVAAGFAVAWLQSLGFSPALKVLTRAMEGVTDDSAKAMLPKSYWQVARKAAASAITLGSGASLGPEAPSVELGANTAAVIAPKNLSKRRQRMLIAAGAAAGVSAAFDAPVSGALFAVEFVLKSSRLGLDRLSTSTVFVSTSVAAGVIGFLRTQGQALGIAGAGTHLVGRIPYFSIQPNLLVDVAQFSALGLGCAVAAVALYEGVRVSEIALRPLPRYLSAPVAGIMTGVIAYRFPQVQYGYVNLEEIFRDSTGMSAADLTALLTAKIVATSVCVGGGLVGGLFAPSLFLGALVGDVMGHFVAEPWGLPDPTSLVVVGAAAVLGAACRAPLTAIALMVEITRDTGLLVPLLAAIGVSSLFTDYLEGIFSKRLEQELVQLYLREKAFFWAAHLVPLPEGAGGGDGVKTVEDVLGTRARLYVRHTLPLSQAKAAMAAKGSSAAVVVDDNFSPLGVVYLEDVEAELIRQRLLNEPDANFNRG
ncbi:hypothetical protein HYH02_006462 [Chlamydomonas schloesseri]|uniref:Chloride channel protein n=1 Tax=Chlamydomonas schloesseri TaxID=2026947 RepID=A0A835WJH7_9CHLO|nr:hypothetical protein HYH02_006462 [Chlamydomonas schloesseri]|eukprot:KAG2448571.1 hypothetical protein HYH02_006462 [Chlamydomonas schloesseri]